MHITSLKKSPTHLVVNKVSISGKPKVKVPVASMMTTVKLMVIRITPPSWAAAPSKAYFAGIVQDYGENVQISA